MQQKREQGTEEVQRRDKHIIKMLSLTHKTFAKPLQPQPNYGILAIV